MSSLEAPGGEGILLVFVCPLCPDFILLVYYSMENGSLRLGILIYPLIRYDPSYSAFGSLDVAPVAGDQVDVQVHD